MKHRKRKKQNFSKKVKNLATKKIPPSLALTLIVISLLIIIMISFLNLRDKTPAIFVKADSVYILEKSNLINIGILQELNPGNIEKDNKNKLFFYYHSLLKGDIIAFLQQNDYVLISIFVYTAKQKINGQEYKKYKLIDRMRIKLKRKEDHNLIYTLKHPASSGVFKI